MTVQCKEIEYCKLHVHYVADPDLVKEKRSEAIQELKRAKVKVPGFREAPKNISNKRKKGKRRVKSKIAGRMRTTKHYNRALKTAYKDKINEMIQKELQAEAYDETLFETQIKPIGYPQITSSYLEGSDFWCDMVFLKKPDFVLNQYKEFDIPKPHMEQTSLEIAEKMLQDLRVQHGDVVMYSDTDTVQMGDQVTADFIATIDGEKCEELTKMGFIHTVGENAIPGFDENLIGMKPDEEREFDIHMGDSFVKDLQGKTAHFKVKIYMGTKKEPCPLDDSLAVKLGCSDYNALRVAAEGQASTMVKNQEKNQISQQIINRLLSSHDFKVPTWLVDMEAQKLAVSAGAQWKNLSDKQKEDAIEKSTKSVKLALIFDSIRDEEPEANISDAESIEIIRKKLTESNIDANAYLSRAQQDGSLIGLVSSLKNEMTLDWLIKQSNILEETDNDSRSTEEIKKETSK